jgi:hypothetical protein
MKIEVDYLDRAGTSSSVPINMSLPCFLKHAALAGRANHLGFAAGVVRALGILMANHEYFSFKLPIGWLGFSPLPPYMFDPTELGDFSTIAGRAVGDYLGKNLLKAKLSHSYEAVMHMLGYQMKGPRPDFYCVTDNEQFALEAKGYSKSSFGPSAMAVRKAQACSGPVPVHFAFASVTYNLYGAVKCKFHDPVVPDAEFNRRLNGALAFNYYESLYQQLTVLGRPEQTRFNNREYLSYDLDPRYFRHYVQRIRLILPMDVQRQLSPNQYLELRHEQYDSERESVYIDSDGVGIQIV